MILVTCIAYFQESYQSKRNIQSEKRLFKRSEEVSQVFCLVNRFYSYKINTSRKMNKNRSASLMLNEKFPRNTRYKSYVQTKYHKYFVEQNYPLCFTLLFHSFKCRTMNIGIVLSAGTLWIHYKMNIIQRMHLDYNVNSFLPCIQFQLTNFVNGLILLTYIRTFLVLLVVGRCGKLLN